MTILLIWTSLLLIVPAKVILDAIDDYRLESELAHANQLALVKGNPSQVRETLTIPALVPVTMTLEAQAA